MRRIVIALMSTVSGVVLLFAYPTSRGTEAAGAAAGTASGGTAPATSQASTYTGDTAQTRWGPVQVEITVQDGKVTTAHAVQYPNDNPRDQQINSYAIPQLNQAVVAGQGAGFDAISGATVTSEGYRQSLQSALDQAHL